MSAALLDRVTALAAHPMEHDGQRVVTLAQVDDLHGRPKGTARNAFKRHKHRMTDGRHFYRQPRTPDVRPVPAGAALLTERGYLLLAKAFNDDVSWRVQEDLVEGYFRAREVARSIPEDAVLISRADLERLQGDANALARTCARLVKAEKAKIGDHARALGRWRGLGPDVRGLADLNPDQALIDGMEFFALAIDAASQRTPEARESRFVDLVSRLAGRTS